MVSVSISVSWPAAGTFVITIAFFYRIAIYRKKFAEVLFEFWLYLGHPQNLLVTDREILHSR